MSFSGLWNGHKYELNEQNELCYAFDEARPWLSIVKRRQVVDFSWRNYCEEAARKIGNYLKNMKYPKPDPEDQKKDQFVIIVPKRVKRMQRIQRLRLLEEIVATASAKSFKNDRVSIITSDLMSIEEPNVVWHHNQDRRSEGYHQKQPTKPKRVVFDDRALDKQKCKLEKQRGYRLEKKKRTKALRYQREEHNKTYYRDLKYYDILAWEERRQKEFANIMRTHRDFLSQEYAWSFVNEGNAWDDLFDYD